MNYLSLIKNTGFITPKWVVLLFDICINISAIFLAYAIRFNFSVKNIPTNDIKRFSIVFTIIILLRLVSYLIGKTYSGLIRYTGSADALRILLVLFSGSFIFAIINLFTFFINGFFLIPYSIIIIEFLLSVFIMVTIRLTIKGIYSELKNPRKDKAGIIIIGSGEMALITKRTLDRDTVSKYYVDAFFTDNEKKFGKKIEGIDIINIKKIDTYIEKKQPTLVIFAQESIDRKQKQTIAEICIAKSIKVLHIPPVNKWINGELSFNQIREIPIEDLLERDPIKLNKTGISKFITNKTVLITGAAGSIGSELVRQICRFIPKELILIDTAETPMHDLELEIEGLNIRSKYFMHLVDIRNKERISNIFVQHKPDIVFHAAAYKHVPMMERNPIESIETNCFGTKILADIAIKNMVDTFVMISTDKAVNPTGVMGATKRLAEIYVQALNNHSKTNFITTRFGNVLGSNGSVIPLFKKQIEKGGPVTVTHPEITRFFMTIPEACQLVLEAASAGNNGKIFVFDMGKSIKIADLAKKMIKLSGMELDKDIKIVYTGLRPGEKLYEELLNKKENILPTYHPQILIAKVFAKELDEVNSTFEKLNKHVNNADADNAIVVLKQIIPEYKSNNSMFEKHDK